MAGGWWGCRLLPKYVGTLVPSPRAWVCFTTMDMLIAILNEYRALSVRWVRIYQ
jgi:hypothetical protein